MGVLILTRRPHETIVIDENIFVTVMESKGNQVRISINAPNHIPVHRREVFDKILSERQGGQGERNEQKGKKEQKGPGEQKGQKEQGEQRQQGQQGQQEEQEEEDGSAGMGAKAKIVWADPDKNQGAGESDKQNPEPEGKAGVAATPGVDPDHGYAGG